MIINDKHIAGIIRIPAVQKELKKIQKNNVASVVDKLDEDAVNEYIENSFDMMFSDDYLKSYLIKETAQIIIANIKTGDKFDLRIFKTFPNERKEIVLNEQELFRYVNEDGIMRILHVSINREGRIFYKSFMLEPDVNKYSDNYFTNSEVKEKCDLFIKILIFLHLSETKEIYLKPNGKTGTKSTGKVLNKSKYPFIIVDSTWNITSIRTEGFSVRGHFRLQAYGKDRTFRKLIFIDQFEKKGYIKKAKNDIYKD